jgi:alpha-L-rhamnosidase
MTKKWQATWIEPQQEPTRKEPPFSLADMFSGKKVVQDPPEERLLPPHYLKKIFTVENKSIKQASLTMTAHGIYQAKINGQAVSEALFAPDYTSYTQYLQYQTYDVTHLLKEKNVWSVTLADGWYAGRVSVSGGSAQFGDRLGILGEIEIYYTDDTYETIVTDEDFFSSHGKYVYSDLFIGEKQDLRLEKENWETDFDLTGFTKVSKADYGFDHLTPQRGPQVKRQEKLAAKSIWWEKDAVIVDFGQVIAGRVQLEIPLADGQEITIEHSEVLDREGHFFNNIVGRNKDQKDVFIGNGREACLKPDFTFHGFRYIKIDGLDDLPDKQSVWAYAIYSDMKPTGSFTTSNQKVNQLIENIQWSQKGNMLSIPTDCPQRERVGWTGDIQVFGPTATFFMDVYDFLGRWLDNVRLEQQADGQIVDYTPAPRDYFEGESLTGSLSSAGWGDAIVLLPWTLYQRYGKLEILAENYQAMKRWLSFSRKSAAGDKTDDKQYLWDTKFHFGDWMFPSFMIGENAKGPMETALATKDLFGTAFLAHSSQLFAQISQLLGEEEEDWNDFSHKVKAAFQKYYWHDDQLTADFQGSYVIALAFGLLDETASKAAAARLSELIIANNYCLDTGFLSIPYLLDVLCDYGYQELALKLLLQEECPSWLYEVNHGATTIWESWASIQPDGTVCNFSFNHYAFGCVGDWLVRRLAGLQVTEPGFTSFTVSPLEQTTISSYHLNYTTAYGDIEIERSNDQFHLRVPQNTKATFQYGENSKVLTSGEHHLTFKGEKIYE